VKIATGHLRHRLDVPECEFLGVSHPVVGSMLAERWKFPENLVECIRRHHDLTVANDLLAECIYLANTISKAAPNSGSMPQFSIPAE
jgi:HD-like signal output (HDOD) protein